MIRSVGDDEVVTGLVVPSLVAELQTSLAHKFLAADGEPLECLSCLFKDNLD